MSAAAPLRILLVRTSSLGDVVQAVPVLVALRRRFPAARIGWVVEEGYASMLEGHPALDELLVVALRRWGRAPLRAAHLAELGAFLERLASFGADVALDLMGSHKGALIAAFSRAPRRIGLSARCRRERESALWINEPVATDRHHAVDRYLALLAPLGAEPVTASFDPEALFARHRPPLPEAVAAGGPYLFLHPGAAWGNKRLPPATWAEAITAIAQRRGLRPWIGAAPGEEELAAEIADRAPGSAVVPASGLPALASLLRAAQLVVGGDTGPVHLAHALGTPVVAVMGPTDPARHGPYAAPGAVVAHRLPCSFCHRRMETPRPCLTAIPAAEIVARALALPPPAA
ncbi:MAG TPA: lipopolysaccharide heptosyltransferase I [Thermoanaerobaculia bacterium]|nr:lipopolysaccharide heptosyltransferase I [Thermoanaerobaculia bacterium]